MQESDKESSKYGCPSVSVEDWFQDPPQIPESMDAHVPYTKCPMQRFSTFTGSASVDLEGRLHFSPFVFPKMHCHM